MLLNDLSDVYEIVDSMWIAEGRWGKLDDAGRICGTCLVGCITLAVTDRKLESYTRVDDLVCNMLDLSRTERFRYIVNALIDEIPAGWTFDHGIAHNRYEILSAYSENVGFYGSPERKGLILALIERAIDKQRRMAAFLLSQTVAAPIEEPVLV